jgi:thiosulfate/3-mercaptopyruvate sulfurtransferase
MFTTLISSEALEGRLGDPAIVIVDCRFKLDDEMWGSREYARSHIPAAVYAHLDRDLSGTRTGANGRHPLPEPETLARTFAKWGITDGVQVITYDQDTSMFASRLWWLLRWLGHDTVAVLDGGFAKWIGEGRHTSNVREVPAPRIFKGSLRTEMTLDADDVIARIGDDRWQLVDARAPERYRGDIEPLDSRAGHIPTAANHHFQRNLSEAGTFRPPEELRSGFRDSIGSESPDTVICYCGSGVTACHNLLALEHAGLHGAKLYGGSWSEWSSDPRRPVETGDRTAPQARSRSNRD